MTDEVLMERVVGGDVEALGTLFTRHKQTLFNYLFRMLHDQTLAEDLVQDAFLRVYERRRRYMAGKAFSTWLFTIAHNLAVDRLKQASRRDICLDTLPATGAEDPDPPHRDTVRLLLAAQVRAAVATLPADQRAVILLREYHALSYREIAEITASSEEAVRVRAFRARQTLKGRLAGVLEQFEETAL